MKKLLLLSLIAFGATTMQAALELAFINATGKDLQLSFIKGSETVGSSITLPKNAPGNRTMVSADKFQGADHFIATFSEGAMTYEVGPTTLNPDPVTGKDTYLIEFGLSMHGFNSKTICSK